MLDLPDQIGKPVVSPRELKARKASAGAAVIKALPELLDAAQWGQLDKVRGKILGFAELFGEEYPAVAAKLARRTPKTLARPARFPDSLLLATEPRHGLGAVVLDEGILGDIRAVVDEHDKVAQLAEFGLLPRHRVLLNGPPGNGKTMVAEAIAFELGLPLLQFRYGGVIDSHLGGTGKNLMEILEFAGTSPCVLFADEFDGLGGSRETVGDVGEMRRITNQLLIELDRLPSHVVFVAATNRMTMMDPALLRRFDFTISIGRPSIDIVRQCIAKELRIELTPGHDLQSIRDQLGTIMFSSVFSVVEACKRVRRDLVLNGGRNLASMVADFEVAHAAGSAP